MRLTLDLVLPIVAFVCFLMAALNVGGRLNLVALGLALWVLSLILHGGG